MANIKSNDGIIGDPDRMNGDGPYVHFAPQSEGGFGKVPAISTKSEGFNNHGSKAMHFNQ